MQGFPNKQAIERLRIMYPTGTRIELISMNDPYAKLTLESKELYSSLTISERSLSIGTAVPALVSLMARILSAKFRAIPTYTPAPLWAGNSIVKTIAH